VGVLGGVQPSGAEQAWNRGKGRERCGDGGWLCCASPHN
jgi:hypothetical protein